MQNFTNWCIIVLLIIAIVYALILNFRLTSFKKSRKEILKAIHAFNQTVQNAETSLSQLQKRTQNVTEQLKIEMNKANQLRDDLILILDKSAHPATHSAVYQSHAIMEKPVTSSTMHFTQPHTTDLFQSDAEKELYSALQKLKEEA